MDRADALMWWRRLAGGGERPMELGAGVRIGVIDVPARAARSLAHVRVFDVEGEPRATDGFGTASHGSRICAIIGERGDAPCRRGVAPGAEIVLIDVSDDLLPDEWDFDKIAPAIRLLVDAFDAHVINISGGCPLEPTDEDFDAAAAFFGDSVTYASERGALVIAATGNSRAASVALPARLDGVVGVGAIGQVGVAPAGSMTHAYQQEAADTPGCVGAHGADLRIFHYGDSTFGEGLNVVGPGCGVVLTFDEDYVVEYHGTSYAAPIVTATLAGSLSARTGLLAGEGERRTRSMLDHLRGMCVDLGLEPGRQGWGMPVMPPDDRAQRA